MVGAIGFEPMTPAVSRQCSTTELRTHLIKIDDIEKNRKKINNSIYLIKITLKINSNI